MSPRRNWEEFPRSFASGCATNAGRRTPFSPSVPRRGGRAGGRPRGGAHRPRADRAAGDRHRKPQRCGALAYRAPCRAARIGRRGPRAILARGLCAVSGGMAAPPRLAGPASRRIASRAARGGRQDRRGGGGRSADAVLGERDRAFSQRRAVAQGPMILAIDCGNSRLQWGLHGNGRWPRSGTVPVAELAGLAKSWKRIAAAAKGIVANVAGRSARKWLQAFFSRRSLVPTWVEAKRRQCGVTNGYGKPAQLGADRWAALIGAWSILRGPCLVVTAGTAPTPD